MVQRLDARLARDFLSRLHAAVNKHDAAAVAELCSADVVWDDPAATALFGGGMPSLDFIVMECFARYRMSRSN